MLCCGCMHVNRQECALRVSWDTKKSSGNHTGGSPFLTTSPLWWRILHSVILNPGAVRQHAKNTKSGNHAKRSNVPVFKQNKSFELSKSTHLEPKREASLFSLPPPLLHDPIFLLCWLGGEKGIFILVSLLEVKVPWDVESEETLPCFPSLVFQPFPAVPQG